MEHLFFQAPGAQKAAGEAEFQRLLPKHKRASAPRKSVAGYLRALDHMLSTVVGFGLGAFVQTEEDALAVYSRRPLRALVFNMDEGSNCLALCWWLQYAANVRMTFVRDIFHRQWRDLTLALKHCGMWSTVLLSSVVYNLHQGPWEGGAWWQETVEASRGYLAHAGPDSPLLKA
eukprot:8376127-Lingulodinium_polyedra.AAC.1